MSLIPRLLVLCATVLLPGTSLWAQAPSVFQSKVESHQGPPLWISAAAVADAEKVVDLDLVDSESLRGVVEAQRRELGPLAEGSSKAGKKPAVAQIPLSDCKQMIDVSDDRGGGASSSFASLATRSRLVFRGKVISAVPGFSYGVPSSLLGIEVSEVIKGTAPKAMVYADYLVAHFRIGSFRFCNLNKGFEPQPGDEVLLFDLVGPVDLDQTLYAPRLDQIFFQRKGEALFLPPGLKNTLELKEAQTLDDVVKRITSGAPARERR